VRLRVEQREHLSGDGLGALSRGDRAVDGVDIHLGEGLPGQMGGSLIVHLQVGDRLTQGLRQELLSER
jgi:hypothetical protein